MSYKRVLFAASATPPGAEDLQIFLSQNRDRFGSKSMSRWLVFFDEIFVLADFGCLVHSKPLRYIPDIARVFPGRFSTNSAGPTIPLKNTSHLGNPFLFMGTFLLNCNNGSVMFDSGLTEYLAKINAVDEPVLNEMHERAVARRFPIVGPEVGRFVHLLTTAIGARTVFELGSGFGYSAFWFAHAVGPDGLVYLTDSNAQNIMDAEDFLARAGLWERCSARVGDAFSQFEAWDGSADIVFMDVDKEQYPNVFSLLDKRLRVGGMLIVDNILWSGRVYSGDESPATLGVLELTRLVRDDVRFLWSVVPIRDGLLTALRVA